MKGGERGMRPGQRGGPRLPAKRRSRMVKGAVRKIVQTSDIWPEMRMIASACWKCHITAIFPPFSFRLCHVMVGIFELPALLRQLGDWMGIDSAQRDTA